MDLNQNKCNLPYTEELYQIKQLPHMTAIVLPRFDLAVMSVLCLHILNCGGISVWVAFVDS